MAPLRGVRGAMSAFVPVDVIAPWLESHVTRQEGSHILTEDAYASFLAWFRQNHPEGRPPAPIPFGRAITQATGTSNRQVGVGAGRRRQAYIGIALRVHDEIAVRRAQERADELARKAASAEAERAEILARIAVSRPADVAHVIRAVDSVMIPAERAQATREAIATETPEPVITGGESRFDTSDVEPKPAKEQISNVEEHRLKQRVRELEAANRGLIRDLSDAQEMAAIMDEASREEVEPIRPRERASGLREGVGLVMASDWHIEEEVRPEQVAGRNRYNLEISARRMERFFESTRWAMDFNRQAFEIRDLVLWLGGDIITNYLHPDNVETNLLSPPQAIAYAQASIIEGIKYLLEDGQLERLVVPCNDGNHGRMTDKMRSASRTAMSLETMLYGLIEREFKDDPRVEFIIARGAHLYYQVYGRTIRFTHGDTVRYGGGIGGVTVPLLKAIGRWDSIQQAALTCVGHFHQRMCLPDLMINGSLIGYGPYSLSIGARFEPPSQNFRILDPHRFSSVDVPLWVGDRDDDQYAADAEAA